MFKDRFKANPEDFVVVIMGPTGCGKTNFINKFTGNAEKQKAGGLRSGTKNVTPYPYPISYQDVRLVLVDTPGFDDSHRQDSEILRVIADWLIVQKWHHGQNRWDNLHRITDNRLSESAYKNLDFGRLCGDAPLPQTRLITTMWDIAKDRETATHREDQLAGDFWGKLIDGGAIARRFYNTSTSAWEIVEDLMRMGKNSDNNLLLQEELVEQLKRLNETEAGKILYSRLQKLLAEQREMLKELTEEAKLQNDPALTKALQKERDKIDAKLQKTFEEMTEMKIPLSRRIRLWLFTRKSRAKAVELDH